MSYNPNQPYSNQPRRGPAGDANGIPYQTHSQYQQQVQLPCHYLFMLIYCTFMYSNTFLQNFAVPKANYNAPVNQLTDVRSMQSSQQYAPMTDNRGVVNGQTHSNPAISNPPANEWDQFFAQSGGADVQGNRGARSAYGAPQAQNRGANTQYAAPAATNYRMNNVYGGQQSEYDPSGLSSLKHTLAQTINSSAANVGGAYQHGDNNAYNPSAGAGAGAASKQHGYFGGNPAAVDAYGARPVGHPGQLPRTQQPYVAAHVASAATGSYNANSSVNLSRTTAAQGPAGLVPGDVRYQSANPQQFAPGVAAAHQQQQQGVRGGAGQYVQSSGFSAGVPLSAGAGGGAAGTVAPGGSYYNRRPEPTAGQQQQQYNKRGECVLLNFVFAFLLLCFLDFVCIGTNRPRMSILGSPV